METNGLKGQNFISQKDAKYRLVVKFKSNDIVNIIDGKPLIPPSQVRNSNDILTNKSFTQIINFSESETASLNTGVAIPPSTKNTFNKESFKGLVYLDNAETLSADSVLAIANELEKLDIVEYAALEPVEPTPPPQVTPDYTGLQGYRKFKQNDDVIGINIDYAWKIGVKGKGVKIADIEWGFDYNHEDLKRSNFIELWATTDHKYDDHGTAVAGVLFAKDNGFGMTGMVHEANEFFGISEISKGRLYAIALALSKLSAGDVLIYEMQAGGVGGQYVPADYNQAVWDLTKSASNAGVIVVAAAGNGAQNLDAPEYKAYMARGDNGSIIVGAGTMKGRNQVSFSTYGSRVNLQGWGDWTVATTGYGDLFNGGSNKTYTKKFSGTSSATPIVASAVVAVQSFAKEFLKKTLTSVEMRELLISTGTPQGSGGHIGLLPNVEAAIKKFKTNLSVYANKSWQDTGVVVSNSNTTTINYVSGKWVFNPSLNSCDGRGDSSYRGKDGYTLEGSPEGALIGRIGGTAFLVGNSVVVPSNLSGKLELCINDDLDRRYGLGLTDNTGTLEVEIITV